MIMAIAARVRPTTRSHYPGIAPSHYTLASNQAATKHKSTLAEIEARPPSRISHDQFYNRMLPYFPELLHEPELSDLQALLLLMVYLIGIYKMGHLWHLSRIISAVAYELGLHRSDANWSNFNPLEREMRKRVYVLTVGLDLKVAKYHSLFVYSNMSVRWVGRRHFDCKIQTSPCPHTWMMNILMKLVPNLCQRDIFLSWRQL